LSVVLFGAYPVMALARRARGFAPMESSRSARLLAILGLTVPVLAVVYLMMVMMVAGTSVFGPVVAGRPLPWLLLQLAALGVAALAIAVVIQTSKRWGDMDTGSKVRFGALVAGTVVFVPWAVYWGLLIV
jgi:hypothetical protein